MLNPVGLIDEQWRSARNILVARLDNLGDVLVTTPAIHAIRTSLPDSRITLFASPVGAQVGLLNPDIDDVLVYQAPWMDPWYKLPLDSEREQAMIVEVKARRFDGAIIFTSYHQSPLPTAYLCYLAEIPLRVAASIDGPGSLLTTRHKHPQRMMHEVESGLDLVAAIGMTTTEQNLVLRVPETARQEVRDVLSALSIKTDGKDYSIKQEIMREMTRRLTDVSLPTLPSWCIPVAVCPRARTPGKCTPMSSICWCDK